MTKRRRRMLRSWLAIGVTAVSPHAGAGDAEVERDGPAEQRSSATRPPLVGARGIERIAGDYVQAFNRGASAVAAFCARSALGARQCERTLELRRTYGPLDVHSVSLVSEGVVALLARAERSGAWVSVTLVLTAAEPRLLVLDRVDPDVTHT